MGCAVHASQSFAESVEKTASYDDTFQHFVDQRGGKLDGNNVGTYGATRCGFCFSSFRLFVFLYVIAMAVPLIRVIARGERRENGRATVKFPTFYPRAPG